MRRRERSLSSREPVIFGIGDGTGSRVASPRPRREIRTAKSIVHSIFRWFGEKFLTTDRRAEPFR